MSSPSMMMSPTLMPMRKSIRCSGNTSALRSAMPRCTSTAQRTASTTLGNSSSRPSPVVLTIRPPYSKIFGSMSSRRWIFKPARVPLSSNPIRREYSTASAETIAASRRWSRVMAPSLDRRTRRHHRINTASSHVYALIPAQFAAGRSRR